MGRASSKTTLRFLDSKCYFLSLLLCCCFMMVACSDDETDDRITATTTTTTTSTTTTSTGGGGGSPPIDQRKACLDLAEDIIDDRPGYTSHQGNACTDNSDFYIIEIIEASRISDNEDGVCCTKRCIEEGAESIVSGVSANHSCLIVGEEAYLQCYGMDNTYGQLGNGCRANVRDESLYINYVVAEGVTECYDRNVVPSEKRLKGVKQVVIGIAHTCALLENGEIKCWGENDQGQLGRSGGPSTSPVNVVLPDGRTEIVDRKVDVRNITAGDYHTCLLAKEGDERIFCWGQNDKGQSGKPFQVNIGSDGIPSWSHSENSIISEPDLIAIPGTPNKYELDNEINCKEGFSPDCRELDSGGFVSICKEDPKDPLQEDTLIEIPNCSDKGGIPICTDSNPPERCPLEGTNDAELAKQLNLRIEAEKITSDSSCFTMDGEEKEVNGGENTKDYDKLGFFDCKLGAHDSNGEEIDFYIRSGKKKFWEGINRDHDLPSISPNFDCEEFYNVDHAKTTGATGDDLRFKTAYKRILCDLSSTTEVNASCEADILGYQAECKSIKSRWASALERLYIRWNFNIPDTQNIIETYRYVSAGSNHTCAVNAQDDVLCFGDNSKDQLGQQEYDNKVTLADSSDDTCEDDLSDEEDFSKYPLRVKNSNDKDDIRADTRSITYMSGVRQIAVGADFNCARITQQDDTGSKVRCWGGGPNQRSVKGNDDKPPKDTQACYSEVLAPQSITPCNGSDTLADITNVTPTELADVQFITAGRTHVCAVRSCSTNNTNEVVCWGDNSKSQLGRGGTSPMSDIALPVVLEFGSGTKHAPLANIDTGSLNAQKDLTCSSKNGEILCWGQYQSPLGDNLREVILPERLSNQCEARDDSASNFLK